MKDLTTLIAALEEHTKNKQACCAIASLGTPDESVLLGTRDGILKLVISLLEFVRKCDDTTSHEQNVDIEHTVVGEKDAFCSDAIKTVFHQLPTADPYIVTSYLFANYSDFIEALEELLKHDLPKGVKLKNDPEIKKFL